MSNSERTFRRIFGLLATVFCAVIGLILIIIAFDQWLCKRYIECWSLIIFCIPFALMLTSLSFTLFKSSYDE